eukprot:CAMPEP_0205905726 /NCGR_PEP_ID=MMETSP1325-20131115/1515_1 /ASSEMBLY_ACC=CAM_ASM_000708 /TAXON_ID=236786 /ORGANISM="Florenciella sp., Strain RCC1007" /LENGTH=475 /DNA_ID=CAMNT_0053271659 /DNA_START=57 /DNA_END=1486 /DNA_ORIENTATION=-
MASRRKPNRTVSAPDNFHFERASSRIDWDRLAGTNVASLQRRGDAAMLGKFIGDVAMGNARGDPEMETHQTHLKAFEMLQLQTQYLLFCHQTMRERHAEVERRLAKLQSHEEAYKRKAAVRKEKIRALAADAQAQDDVLQSYHAMLEMADPEKAARIAWTDDGRVVLQEKQPLRRTRRHKAAQKKFAKAQQETRWVRDVEKAAESIFSANDLNPRRAGYVSVLDLAKGLQSSQEWALLDGERDYAFPAIFPDPTARLEARCPVESECFPFLRNLAHFASFQAAELDPIPRRGPRNGDVGTIAAGIADGHAVYKLIFEPQGVPPSGELSADEFLEYMVVHVGAMLSDSEGSETDDGSEYEDDESETEEEGGSFSRPPPGGVVPSGLTSTDDDWLRRTREAPTVGPPGPGTQLRLMSWRNTITDKFGRFGEPDGGVEETKAAEAAEIDEAAHGTTRIGKAGDEAQARLVSKVTAEVK